MVGCANDPIKVDRTDNPDMNVSLLFEKDGNKIYRFSDAGHYVYYVVPSGQTMQNVNCGRGCVRMESVTTSNTNTK